MEKQKKVIVAHPFRQHSFELAKALEMQGILCSYCTTVYDKPKSLMGFAKKILNNKWKNKASGRKAKGIPDDKVVLFCELRGYLALLINHFSKNINFTRLYQRYLYRSFGRKVANYAKKINADAVIIYDTTATECFRRLEGTKIIKILDMAAISRKYARHIYEKEQEKYGFDYFTKTQRYLWNDKVLEYMNEEIDLANYYIVASDFTKRSLNYCGILDDVIETVPYGVDLSKFYPAKYIDKVTDKLKIVFVGHVDYQKGLHHLFEALKNIPADDIQVDIYGVYNEDDAVVRFGRECCNANYHGFVTADQLREVYQNSDIMVFPSTNDGYGLVVLEALACGLPVVCSKNAGACDVIHDGENGFTFTSGDINKLREIITWCKNHKLELMGMRNVAADSVQGCNWCNYYKMVGEFVKNTLDAKHE